MSTYPKQVIYAGTRLSDIVGKSITVAELADRLNRPTNTVRAQLSQKGAIKRGIIYDNDISHYLEDASVINVMCAAMALSARAWR